jgi:hypothetical protein
MDFTVFIGFPAQMTPRPISYGSIGSGTNSYSITSGTFQITQWPSKFPGCGKATFNFSATGTAGTVNVTEGSLTVWIYAPDW